MKRNYTLIAFALTLFFSGTKAFAQMVGDCVFLQAAHLEVGIAPIGAYGSTRTAPAGYHPSGAYSLWDPGAGAYFSTGLLGFVADPALDGWAVGAPPMFGDYFLPGTPQEGWSVMVNGTQSNAWLQALSSAGTGYSGTLTGTNISYSTAGGIVTGIWKGTAGPLQITQTTKLNTSKLYFTVNVILKNTSGATANNVFYQRTLDPDNEEIQSGSFTTFNKITNQLPNPGNKVMVTSAGTSYSAAFLGLGTKDCRAKCYMIDFGLTPSYNLDQLYNQTTPYYYAQGATYTYDAGIGLVYKLGNLAAGDSTSLTFAYVMRAVDLDSALDVTAPTVVAGSTLITPGSDTINACTIGTDSVLVSIANGGSYSWVWSPATGLSSTTGTSSYVLLDSLTGIVTYTVIGTPISGGLCANDTFHFTVIPGTSSGPGVTPVVYCQYASATPLTATGTSLLWYTSATGGTGSPTAPTPSTTAVGTYTWWVSQTIGICGESVRVPITVTIKPQPHVVAGSNSPVCANNPILLTATDTTTSGTYAWTGPLGFTSTMKNPVIATPTVTATGWYYVTLTANGCSATDSTYVVVHPSPLIMGTLYTSPSACNLSDGTITIYGFTPDSTYTLFYSYNGGAPISITFTASPTGSFTIPGLHAGLYSNIYIVNSWYCASNPVIVNLPDGAGPGAPVATSNGPVCADSTLMLFATSSATGITYNWAGPGGFTSTLQNPVIPNPGTGASGIYYVTVTVTSSGCVSAAGSVAVVVKPKPTVPVITSNSPVCAGTALNMHATSYPAGATFTWSGPASYSATGANPVIDPAAVANSGTYTVYATLNGCQSLPGTGTMTVNPIPAAPTAAGATYCQFDAATALSASGTNLWYTSSTGGTGNATDPLPGTLIAGSTTWYVSQTALGCESPRTPVTVVVNPKPVVSITPARSYVCQGDTITLCSTGTPVLTGASYHWTLPAGTTYVSGSDSSSGCITVRVDSPSSNQVSLTVMANGCVTTQYYTIHSVPRPVTGLYIAPEICVGDTTTLALISAAPGINSYAWHADSTHLHIVTATSGGGGGGPFSVYWDTAGAYVIGVTAFSSQEMCPSITMYDTVHVRPLPDATFAVTGGGCGGDSIFLSATSTAYSYSYAWGPSTVFMVPMTTPTAWGIIYSPSYVFLTVTDPFGCSATDSMMVSPAACCRATLPDAFSPNGDGRNDRFRLMSEGQHLLKTFRVVNRWGTTMFETTNSNTTGWDGNYNGVPQDMGTYFWYLNYTCDGHTFEQSGTVTLVR